MLHPQQWFLFYHLCMAVKPLNRSKAEDDIVMNRNLLFSWVNYRSVIMLNSFSSHVLYLRTSSRAAHPLKGRHVDLAHNSIYCKMENQGYRAWSCTTGFFL